MESDSTGVGTEIQVSVFSFHFALVSSGDIKTKTETRGVSPSVRSTIPSQIPGFSNDTPLNLRTDRATSATRGRLAAANPTASISQKQDPTPRPRRQSCSPSVTRGRKESNEENLTSSKGKTVTGNNGAQIFGSRMVDKVMSARKFGAEDREAKPKQQSATKSANSSANTSPGQGFGRMMMTKSKMDMDFKHMIWSYITWQDLVLSQANP
ncbi:hypothetical protein OIU77_013726 [Salix suchowensis]|uniref:Uncharacterized protein n=1 Tax=Salix suchowensis TaxID=1278906 RepID=A0ABQ8ZUZ7_9ROSI|nr:hypothetical protein OIU77_013726 [Salix suchowensis]